MPAFFKKPKIFDVSTLRKNDISILILDERWGNLKSTLFGTNNTSKHEQELVDLLKKQAKLIEEEKSILPQKKKYMEKIMALTTEAYENNNPKAKDQMKVCQQNIENLNKKNQQIKTEIEELPYKIKHSNLKLLESVVNRVYDKINSRAKRVDKLNKRIDTLKTELKMLIEERGILKEEYEMLYTYFHDLLGAEELEKLDFTKMKNFYKKESKNEGCDSQTNEDN